MGVVGLFPEVGSLSLGVRAALVGVAVMVTAGWAAPLVIGEVVVAWRRVDWHDRVYARLEHEKARADREALNAERERIRMVGLSMMLTAYLVHPTRYRRAVFRMDRPRLQDDELLVALRPEDPRAPSNPRAGEVLTLVDPDDGKWQGTAEVLTHRSLSGEVLARIVDADSVFQSFLEEKASQGEAYALSAVAVYVRMAEGAIDG